MSYFNHLPAEASPAPNTRNREGVSMATAAAFYAVVRDSLTLGVNPLTGKVQSWSNKTGWLLNTAA